MQIDLFTEPLTLLGDSGRDGALDLGERVACEAAKVANDKSQGDLFQVAVNQANIVYQGD